MESGGAEKKEREREGRKGSRKKKKERVEKEGENTPKLIAGYSLDLAQKPTTLISQHQEDKRPSKHSQLQLPTERNYTSYHHINRNHHFCHISHHSYTD